jgi:hypothetical protein
VGKRDRKLHLSKHGECLWTGDLMDQMSADEQLSLAIPQFPNCVRLPYFLKESSSHFFYTVTYNEILSFVICDLSWSEGTPLAAPGNATRVAGLSPLTTPVRCFAKVRADDKNWGSAPYSRKLCETPAWLIRIKVGLSNSSRHG